jgi:pyruvate ferredoxin oxidoreductase delta subunit
MKPRGWRELNDGPIIKNPGNSTVYKTGSWRTQHLEFLKENCSNCMLCWLYCPDMSIIVADGRVTGIDFEYCKGCGICALECSGKKGNKAILMQGEVRR